MQEKMEFRSFIALLILVSIFFIMLLAPFFGVIFWAVAIGIVFAPINKMLLEKTKRENLSALCTLLLCILIVVLPFLFVLNSFIGQGVLLFDGLQSGEINVDKYVEQVRVAFPVIQEGLAKIGFDLADLEEKIGELVVFISRFIAQQSVAIGQGTLTFIAEIGMLLYVAFFIIRDSDTLVRYLHLALPLGDEREAMFFKKFSEVTRATIKGSFVVAVVQGFLGGVIFAILGIPGVFLWGVAMVFLSLVPMIGSALIWAPVALYLMATGDILSGTILIAFGIGVIGLVDNILRPLLVGRDTNLPDYLVLLSTLGGFTMAGMNGFVIGPLIATLFVTSWDIFIREFNMEKRIGSDI